jgi:hypothetical protein
MAQPKSMKPYQYHSFCACFITGTGKGMFPFSLYFLLFLCPPEIDSLSGPNKKSISFPNNHLSIGRSFGPNYIHNRLSNGTVFAFFNTTSANDVHFFEIQQFLTGERSRKIKDWHFVGRVVWPVCCAHFPITMIYYGFRLVTASLFPLIFIPTTKKI